MQKKLSLILFVFLAIFTACEKEPKHPFNTAITETSKGFLVCNEGNFMSSNASLSFINTDSNLVYNDVFKQANGHIIGDVLQSAVLHQGKIYCVVNNSGKIEVINASDFKLVNTISGLKSPRYILPVNSEIAYVSDLYDNAISLINLQTGALIQKINMPGWTEEMLLYSNKLYVCNITKPYALSVNINTNQIADTLYCGYASNSLVKDINNHIWILSAGDKLKSLNGFLTCFDPTTSVVIKQFEFSSDNKRKLRINKEGNKLFWLSDADVYTMNISDSILPQEALISGSGKTFYNLAVDKTNNRLVVTDAKDFNQNGSVWQYNLNGQLVNSFKVGVIPGEICFLN